MPRTLVKYKGCYEVGTLFHYQPFVNCYIPYMLHSVKKSQTNNNQSPRRCVIILIWFFLINATT